MIKVNNLSLQTCIPFLYFFSFSRGMSSMPSSNWKYEINKYSFAISVIKNISRQNLNHTAHVHWSFIARHLNNPTLTLITAWFSLFPYSQLRRRLKRLPLQGTESTTGQTEESSPPKPHPDHVIIFIVFVESWWYHLATGLPHAPETN